MVMNGYVMNITIHNHFFLHQKRYLLEFEERSRLLEKKK